MRQDSEVESDGDRLAAMRLLASQPRLSQRELSRHLGLSLGKTNYLLRAILERGHMKVQNFRRSDNKMAYVYLLTPRGLKEKARLTRAFLARKEAEFEGLQAMIETLRTELRHAQEAGEAEK
jgi:EPS-associated MarR family transcriptional regulator